MPYFARVAYLTLIAVGGCSGAATDDPEQIGTTTDDSKQIGTATEAIAENFSTDFKIGLVVVNQNANGSVSTSLEVTTPWASQIVGTEAWSGWAAVGVADPTGIQLHLISNLAHSTGTLFQSIDFRIGIEAKDSNSDVGAARWTGWASDIVGPSLSGFATEPSGGHPGFYRVGIGIRVWPTSHRSIRDFVIGGMARGWDSFVQGYEYETETTPWAMSGGGWSPIIAPKFCHCIQDGISLGLNTIYTNQ